MYGINVCMLSTCLNRGLCFFWVLSLAYPNLLGKKAMLLLYVIMHMFMIWLVEVLYLNQNLLVYSLDISIADEDLP